MKLQNLFANVALISIYKVIDDVYENELEWNIEPTDYQFIPYNEDETFCVASKEITSDRINDCYLIIHLPERIAERVIKHSADGPIVLSVHDQESTIVPAVASQCYGDYSLYFTNEQPEIGINILKTGLAQSPFKGAMAEDLGYIFRDLGRNDEAIEAFLISEEEGVSSEYIYWELTELYKNLGWHDRELEYKTKFEAI
jgi:hypothetical protein